MENCNKKNVMKYILLIIILFIYVVSICSVEIQSDTLFDIKLGESYQKNGVWQTDEFSIHENLNYVSHHFAATLLLYNVYNIFGLTGIYILEIILALVLAMLFYRLNTLISKDKVFCYLMVFIEMLMIQPFISVRAQMFSAILFLMQLIIINILKKKKLSKFARYTLYVSLSVLPMLIVNLHAGVWPFYYIIMGSYILDFIIRGDKKNILTFIIISFISIFTMFINVYGIEIILYVFKTMGNSFINTYITEFQPLNIAHNAASIISIFVVVIFFSASKSKKEPCQIFLLIICVCLALMSSRHYIFFAICFPVIIGCMEGAFFCIRDNFCSNKKVVFAVLAMLYIEVIAALLGTKNYEFLANVTCYPKEAVNYIKKYIPENARILNSYNYGTYMLFNDIKVFVDNRADLYTTEYNNVTIAEDEEKFKRCSCYYMDIIEKYDIEYVFIEVKSNVVEYLRKDDRFSIMYEDENSIIFQYVS